MTNFFYSAKTNLFYPADWINDYVQNDSLPDDIKPVSDDIVAEYSCYTQNGKVRISGEDGLPTWVNVPLPVKEELVIIAGMEKSNLLNVAHQTISIWQTELQLGSITDTDKNQLINWLAYIKKLNLIDTSVAPDIEWPQIPA